MSELVIVIIGAVVIVGV